MLRRSFLQGLLFVAAAPAIVRIDSLMRLPPQRILKPDGYGEGLAVDMLDIHGDVIQSALLRRTNASVDGGVGTSMLECYVPRSAWVTTFRIREQNVVKYQWCDGGTWVHPNCRTIFYDRT
jgi:hypothetical protein